MQHFKYCFVVLVIVLISLCSLVSCENASDYIDGSEVTIVDPEDKTGGTKITGKVDEASFEDGTGSVKVNGKNYSIAYITSVKN